MSSVVASGVWKRFRLRQPTLRDLATSLLRGRRGDPRAGPPFWALKDVSFAVDTGSTLALIGENGSGKSTMLKVVAGLMPPTKGSVAAPGRTVLLSHLGAGFHPELTGRDNVFLQGAIRDVPRRDLIAKLDDILDFAECTRFADVALKFYSTGMRSRLAFAIATHIDPEILLIDEALAVGDAAFRDRCLDRIQRFRSAGVTMVVVSHERYLMEQLCAKAVLLHRGEVQAEGVTSDVFTTYEHLVRRDHAHMGSMMVEGDPAAAPLHLETVTIVGHERDQEPVLQPDDPLRLRMAFRATRAVHGAVIGVQMSREWHVLHGTRSSRQDIEIDANEGQAVTLELVYPRLNLMRGTYALQVHILEHRLQHQAVLRIKRVAQFRVTHDEREGVGLVRIPHEWKLID